MEGLTKRYDFREEIGHVAEDAARSARRKGRDARFSIEVVSRYHHTCALTGYSLVTEEGATIVDAAHIHQRAKSQDDRISNGLALSKNAHWMFDQGLWGIEDDLRIVVARERFAEAGPDAFLLRDFAGRLVQFSPKATLRPDPECLRAHRREHGLGEL